MSANLRLVMVSKRLPEPVEGSPGRVNYVLREVGHAFFHQFGVDYEEFTDGGPGNYSTAIVEWFGGRVEAVRVENIRFLTDANGVVIGA